MPNEPTITLHQLLMLAACAEQRELFEKLFGGQVTLTLALCLEHADRFDWPWAADHFLDWPYSDLYGAEQIVAVTTYNDSLNSAQEARDMALRAEDKAHELARRGLAEDSPAFHETVVASAAARNAIRATYRAARRALETRLNRVCAAAFYLAYKGQRAGTPPDTVEAAIKEAIAGLDTPTGIPTGCPAVDAAVVNGLPPACILTPEHEGPV